MLLITLTLIALLVTVTYLRWDTVSPKLLVREAASIGGAVVGATPEVLSTTVRVMRASNAVSEVALREAGLEGPVGFREGRVVSARATRLALSDINSSARSELEVAKARLAEMAAADSK